LETKISVNDKPDLPNWLSFDHESNKISVEGNHLKPLGKHKVTIKVTDCYNNTGQVDFYITIELAPFERKKPIVSIMDEIALNHNYFELLLPDIGLFFDIPSHVAVTTQVSLPDNYPLPEFLNYEPENNTLFGIPGKEDIRQWDLQYKAITREGSKGNIDFKVIVKGKSFFTMNHKAHFIKLIS